MWLPTIVGVRQKRENCTERRMLSGSTSTSSSSSGQTKTDANGKYVFSGVPAGTYHLVVRVDGYQVPRQDVTVATAALNARRRFAAPMLAPVCNNLVVPLLLLNDFPNAVVSSEIKPSQTIGAADLTINVSNAPGWASGQVDMEVVAAPVALPQVQAKRVRALAVLSERRTPALPEVPTANVETGGWEPDSLT